MDFLQAVKQAQQQGIRIEQFLPIWEAEVKLRQQKEEVRLLELKLQMSEQGKDGESFPDGIESLIKQQFKQQRKELNQIKSDLLLYQQAMLQVVGDISSLLTSVIAPNVPLGGTQQQGNNIDQAAALNLVNHLSFDKSLVHRNKHQDAPKEASIQKSLEPRHMPKSNALFAIENVSSLIESGAEKLSSHLIVPDCQFSFQLAVSFNENKELVANIVASKDEVSDNVMKLPVVSGKGYVQNKSKGYSLIWAIPSGTEHLLTNLKENRINAPICLKTSGGKFESVTLDLLETRNFLLEDTITFKWGLEVKEAPYHDQKT